jgi:2-keto-4-pentenoate hydratase/2-oxohepta-3-ene-1,7-dioic acid hydratase in catechol pathway
MKFARYLAHGQVSYGVVDGDSVKEITTTPFEDYQVTDHTHGLSEVKLLPPTAPSKMFAVGLNYVSHLHDRPAPTEPLIFLKTPSSLIGPGDTIVKPRDVETLQEEGELVIVIGKRCRNVSKADALDYVLGYSCGNDVSAREWQRGDGQWWRAKSADTFSPVGPVISDEINPDDAMLRIRVNGNEVRAESTSSMVFDVRTAIEWISRRQTLEAGDLIFTGTHGTPVNINPGDMVDIEIDGIGVLSNPVRMEE